MTTPAEHYLEAERLLDEARKTVATGGHAKAIAVDAHPEFMEMLAVAVAEAQVHATLATVSQGTYDEAERWKATRS